MNKNVKIIIILVLVLITALAASSCNKGIEVKSYKLRYSDANGETKTVSVKIGEAYSIAIPQKPGYTFKGLFDQESGGVQYVGSNGLSIVNWNEEYDRNLFAQWAPKNITIFFEYEGGTGDESSVVVAYDSTVEAFPSAARTGHTFLGWYDSTAAKAVAFSNNIGRPSKNKMSYSNYPTASEHDEVTLYAKWEIIQIPVTFNSNKGNIHPSLASQTTTTVIDIPYGSTIDAYAPKDGDFGIWETPSNGVRGILRWFASSSASGSAFSGTITDNITLYAQWAPAIIFDMQDDTPKAPIVAMANTSISITPPTITKAGYTFVGWIDDGNNKFNQSTMPTDGGVLKPEWELVIYSINYVYNGGVAIPDAPSSYNVAMPYFTLSTSSKEHYTFEGWYDNANFTGSAITGLGEDSGINRNLTLHAKWNPVTYTITYNYNGGSIISGAPTTYNVATPYFTLPATSNKAYYIFDGWYDNANFTGSAITGLGTGSDINRNLTLHAKWNPIVYSITYNYNGGTTISDAPSNYNVAMPYFTLPTTSTRAYYVFDGWYDNSSFSGNSIEGLGTGASIGGNLTLYAKWQKEKEYEHYKYVSTVNQFKAIENDLEGKYLLVNNLDLGSSWIPLGSYSWTHTTTNDQPASPFRGILNGNGYTIKYSSTIDNLSKYYDYGWGLFGSSSGATFLNLTLDAQIISYSNSVKVVDCYECCAGALVGLSINSSFENCKTTNSSNITNQDTDRTYYVFLSGMYDTGATYTGGLIGDARVCTFKNCTNSATVYSLGYQAYSGGIAGNAYECTITNCFNTGSISSSHGGWIWGIDNSGNLAGKIMAPWLRSDGNPI